MAPPKPTVTITYCPGCRWLPRSAWMAQELLGTFDRDLAGVTLRPSAEAGVFTIEVGGETVWDRRRDGGFPEIKILKQRVRDRLDPGRDLGHIDRSGGSAPAGT
ncbi:MAG: SelT/SelW/SelH family protein [Opitutales bacterium]|nr:SelT/SelW/SelH family protein [Opitutales bacterium]